MEIFKHFRFINGFISVVTVISFQYFYFENWILWHSIAVSAIVFLSLSAGNIINDYFDFATDEFNKKRKSNLKPSSLISVYILLIILIALLTITMNAFESIVLIIVNNLLLFYYSFYLKNKHIAGHILIALLSSSILLLLYFENKNSAIHILFPFLFIFFIHFIRELVKSAEDYPGDLLANVHTFSVHFGLDDTRKVLQFFISLFMLLLIVPSFLFRQNSYFVIILFIFYPILIWIFWTCSQKELNFSLLSKVLKILMTLGIGLISVFAHDFASLRLFKF